LTMLHRHCAHQKDKYLRFLKSKTSKLNGINPRLRFRYSLKFNTIISPYSIRDTRLLFYGGSINSGLSLNQKKLIIKQSYMLMTWAAYVHNQSLVLSKTAHRPSFAHLPNRRNRFTITKAPIAHKTFSQEQYQYEYYTLLITFQSGALSSNQEVPSINESLYLASRFRQPSAYSGTGTNLFFLSRAKFQLPVTDDSFFTI